MWYYKDPSGLVRGPFSTTDMRVWSERGYFASSLEIAREETGPFLSLGEVFPVSEGVAYFGRVMENKEFSSRVTQLAKKKQEALQAQLQVQLTAQLIQKRLTEQQMMPPHLLEQRRKE